MGLHDHRLPVARYPLPLGPMLMDHLLPRGRIRFPRDRLPVRLFALGRAIDIGSGLVVDALTVGEFPLEGMQFHSDRGALPIAVIANRLPRRNMVEDRGVYLFRVGAQPAVSLFLRRTGTRGWTDPRIGVAPDQCRKRENWGDRGRR